MVAGTTGQTAGINFVVRPRDDNFGLEYTGYLNVPADGTYTFYLTTDSRAFLRLHDAALIDADFGYAGGTEVSATIPLKAGYHALRLAYAHGAVAAAFHARWHATRCPAAGSRVAGSCSRQIGCTNGQRV